MDAGITFREQVDHTAGDQRKVLLQYWRGSREQRTRRDSGEKPWSRKVVAPESVWRSGLRRDDEWTRQRL